MISIVRQVNDSNRELLIPIIRNYPRDKVSRSLQTIIKLTQTIISRTMNRYFVSGKQRITMLKNRSIYSRYR